MKILIVEDEPKTGDYLKQGLVEAGFNVDLVRDGMDGLHFGMTEAYDLIVLDVMLPGLDGWRVLQALRKAGKEMPVLFLTAKDSVDDRVKGLELGADDYLVKPFAFEELLARIRALLRRGRVQDVLRFVVADLEADRVTRRVTRGDRDVELTAREYELLDYLLLHQGRVVSREMLARDVWHEVARATPLDNVIDVHIARLRRKIDNGHGYPLIHTLRGVGFVLQEQAP